MVLVFYLSSYMPIYTMHISIMNHIIIILNVINIETKNINRIIYIILLDLLYSSIFYLYISNNTESSN